MSVEKIVVLTKAVCPQCEAFKSMINHVPHGKVLEYVKKEEEGERYEALAKATGAMSLPVIILMDGEDNIVNHTAGGTPPSQMGFIMSNI